MIPLTDIARRARRSLRARLARAMAGLRSALRWVAARARRAAYATADCAPARRLLLAGGRPLRIGGMATMPTRAASLPLALASILPQVDRLYVYLDKHDAVPQALKGHRKIVPILPADLPRLIGRPQNQPPLNAAGKFLATLLEADGLFFGFDDDIIYPRDYTRALSAALAARGNRALVGVFGVVYREPYRSYVNDRITYHFAAALAAPRDVDALGTGTVAFDMGVYRPDFLAWESTKMLDLKLAIEAHGKGLSRVAIRRPPDYLKAIAEAQADSLWKARLASDTVESAVLAANAQLWLQRIPATGA